MKNFEIKAPSPLSATWISIFLYYFTRITKQVSKIRSFNCNLVDIENYFSLTSILSKDRWRKNNEVVHSMVSGEHQISHAYNTPWNEVWERKWCTFTLKEIDPVMENPMFYLPELAKKSPNFKKPAHIWISHQPRRHLRHNVTLH